MIAAQQGIDDAFGLMMMPLVWFIKSTIWIWDEFTKCQHDEIANEMKSEQREEAAAIYNLLGEEYLLDMWLIFIIWTRMGALFFADIYRNSLASVSLYFER